jgi:hypothetical protein
MGGSGQHLFLHVRSIPSNLEKSNKGTVIFADQLCSLSCAIGAGTRMPFLEEEAHCLHVV